MNAPATTSPDPRAGAYYVSVVDGKRVGLLAGPFPAHALALEQVEPARALAQAADPWSHFYAFGTCRFEVPMGPGRFNKQLILLIEEKPQ